MSNNRELSKKIILFSGIIIAFLCYSYYNYNRRSKALELVEIFRKKNHQTSVSWYRDMHFNVFDYLISDKTQLAFIQIDTATIYKKDNSNYELDFTSWKDPIDFNSNINYGLKRVDNRYLWIIDI
jgi:hypothetical protein